MRPPSLRAGREVCLVPHLGSFCLGWPYQGLKALGNIAPPLLYILSRNATPDKIQQGLAQNTEVNFLLPLHGHCFFECILHKEHGRNRGEVSLHQKGFRETLALELSETGSTTSAEPGQILASHHKPVHISGHSTAGRLRCRHCQTKTPVKCATCDVPLCFVPGRDCYNDWHVANSK